MLSARLGNVIAEYGHLSGTVYKHKHKMSCARPISRISAPYYGTEVLLSEILARCRWEKLMYNRALRSTTCR